jgi:hypothetical protein
VTLPQFVEGGRLPSRHPGDKAVIRVELGIDGGQDTSFSQWMDRSPQGTRCEEPAGVVWVTWGYGCQGIMLPKGGIDIFKRLPGLPRPPSIRVGDQA